MRPRLKLIARHDRAATAAKALQEPHDIPSVPPDSELLRLRQPRSSTAPSRLAQTADAGAPRAQDWLLWQLADSAFPTGGFAHSGGLEAASQQGEVRSAEELASFMQTSLEQAGAAALPFVSEAFFEPHRFGEIDRLCDAFLSNHVTNRASRAQGQGILLVVDRAFPQPSLRELRSLVSAEQLPGHLAPVFGAVTRHLAIDHSSALRLFLFQVLRALVAGAVRLGLIGPLDGQGLQARLAPLAEQVKCRSEKLRALDAAQTAPLLDILHGAQDRLYSRLFQS